MTLTKPQRKAVFRVWRRVVEECHEQISYRRFRKERVELMFGCIMVPFAGMWLGIEEDGYTHS